ncbi:MAG TPA: methylated-DNA--protein-cysteine methyltransferase, partial [Phenylobacterium sp.]|nr:methylated-DNA--protein-cysteine methyltransferase [Phenylobacterium sp.]
MPISNAQPEILTHDRLATPIGTALLVTDERGELRAFNWTDYEPAMQAWIGRHYPKAERREGRSPAEVRGAFEAYFHGEARALEAVP